MATNLASVWPGTSGVTGTMKEETPVALDYSSAAPKTINTSGLTPVEYFVVVALDPVEEKTAGGIYIPEKVKDKDELSAQEGQLIAASPLAFTYEQWPEGSRKPEAGDRVLFKRYAGVLHERDGKKYRLINDKDVIAIVEGS